MSNKTTFSVGDIVKLKSGGPDMTVNDVRRNYDTKQETGMFGCQWFAGKKLDSGTFPFESLMLVTEEK